MWGERSRDIVIAAALSLIPHPQLGDTLFFARSGPYLSRAERDFTSEICWRNVLVDHLHLSGSKPVTERVRTTFAFSDIVAP